jgi:DNA-binding LacI/PurR family transcriptional regulator
VVSSIANPFYPEFALAAERAARERGRFLIVCNTNDDPDTGRAYLDQMAGTLSDGVLIMNANLPMDELKKTEQRGARWCCACGRNRTPRPSCPASRWTSMRPGDRCAHLLALGHRHIGALVGSKKSGIHAERYRGFVEACAAAGTSTACRARATSVIRLKPATRRP